MFFGVDQPVQLFQLRLGSLHLWEIRAVLIQRVEVRGVGVGALLYQVPEHAVFPQLRHRINISGLCKFVQRSLAHPFALRVGQFLVDVG